MRVGAGVCRTGNQNTNWLLDLFLSCTSSYILRANLNLSCRAGEGPQHCANGTNAASPSLSAPLVSKLSHNRSCSSPQLLNLQGFCACTWAIKVPLAFGCPAQCMGRVCVGAPRACPNLSSFPCLWSWEAAEDGDLWHNCGCITTVTVRKVKDLFLKQLD